MKINIRKTLNILITFFLVKLEGGPYFGMILQESEIKIVKQKNICGI